MSVFVYQASKNSPPFCRLNPTARDRYYRHRASAKHRGIAFLFTFEEWLKVWFDSGHWGEQSRNPGAPLAHRYVMGRFGDVGPYAPGNVHIITRAQNAKDACRYRLATLPPTLRPQEAA